MKGRDGLEGCGAVQRRSVCFLAGDGGSFEKVQESPWSMGSAYRPRPVAGNGVTEGAKLLVDLVWWPGGTETGTGTGIGIGTGDEDSVWTRLEKGQAKREELEARGEGREARSEGSCAGLMDSRWWSERHAAVACRVLLSGIASCSKSTPDENERRVG